MATFPSFHSSWQELHLVSSSHCVAFLCRRTDPLQRPQPRPRLVVPMRSPKIVRAPPPSYMRMYSHFLLSADVKAKRKPSAYNLFVKEHMKVYLAEHPGKTNKDAMKHVCLATLSTFLTHQVFRSAHFGKMHPKIQSAARTLRRRIPRLPSGQRKPQQRSPRVMRARRLSPAAMNESFRVS